MICSRCSTENPDNVPFCNQCGRKLSTTSAPAGIKAKKKMGAVMVGVIAVASLAVFAGVTYVALPIFIASAPTEIIPEIENPSITSKNVDGLVLQSSDFPSNWQVIKISDSTDYSSYKDSDFGIFNASCDAHNEVESALAKGSSISLVGFKKIPEEVGVVSLSQQVLEFKTEKDALAAFESFPSGELDPKCDYLGSDGTSIHYVTPLTLRQAYGSTAEGIYVPSITEFDTLGFSGQTQTGITIMRRGSVVTLITVKLDAVMGDLENPVEMVDLHAITMRLIDRFNMPL